MINPYSFNTYQSLIMALIREKPKNGRGEKAALAAFIKCQATYLSHVLANRSNFTPEQMEAAIRYFKLPRQLGNYMMLLLHHQRAGTPALRAFYQEQIDKIREDAIEVESSIAKNKELSTEQKTRYYSTWFYSAIHILVTIPGFQNEEAIATKLGISNELVSEGIEFLLSAGLIARTDAGYKVLEESIHLPRKSPEIKYLHCNHRLRAMEAINSEKKQDLHYSAYFSCKQENIEEMKLALLAALKDFSSQLEHSEPTTLGAICIDLYSI